MTQPFPSDSLTSTDAAPVHAEGQTSSASGTVAEAKSQAGSLGQGAAEAGQHVAAVTKDQVQNVIAEAGTRANDLLRDVRGELREQAATQQQRLAQGLHALADELHSMSRHAEQPGLAADLTRQGARRSQEVAHWLETREPGNVIEELKTFARRRPGMFLLAAAGAGLVAGRLTRGVKDATDSDSLVRNEPSTQPRAVPATTLTSETGLGLGATSGQQGGEYGGGRPSQPDFVPLGDGR